MSPRRRPRSSALPDGGGAAFLNSPEIWRAIEAYLPKQCFPLLCAVKKNDLCLASIGPKQYKTALLQSCKPAVSYDDKKPFRVVRKKILLREMDSYVQRLFQLIEMTHRKVTSSDMNVGIKLRNHDGSIALSMRPVRERSKEFFVRVKGVRETLIIDGDRQDEKNQRPETRNHENQPQVPIA